VMNASRTHTGRAGFTLMELLVVIAIIGVLVSMTMAAITNVVNRAKEAKLQAEIDALGIGVQAFTDRYHRLPPSRLYLSEVDDYRNADGSFKSDLYRDSYAVLKAMAPNLTFPIDWNGDGARGNSSATLEGDQCLVFFLGGAQRVGRGNIPT